MKLNIDGIDFSYNGRAVLKDVSLKLNKGEILGLIGPNGSGKSTFIRCINQILKPDRGVVSLNKRDIKDFKRAEIARNMGYVPQQESRKFPANVFDTILMGRKPYIKWKPDDRDYEIVSGIIEMLGLEEFAMRDINELSGGEKQKVMIGRSLAQKPEVLLLDEPTSNLDLRHQLEILDLIREQTKDNISAIIAIHDLSLAGRYCDKLVLLNEGEVFAAGGLEVLSARNIEKVYGVKVRVENYAGRVLVIPDQPV